MNQFFACCCALAMGFVLTMPLLAEDQQQLPTPPPLAEDDIFAPYVHTVPKIVTVVSEEAKDGVKITRLRFASVEGTADGKTQPNEIYAVLAQPAAPATAKRPGILACHGGGGSAAEATAIAYAKLGYISVAPDLPGYGKQENLKSVTRMMKLKYGEGRFVVTPDPHASVLFDTVTAGILAFNLLESQPGIDKSRIGLTGISWGGYMVTMLSGIMGERIKAVFNLYGSGFYQIDAIGTKEINAMPEQDRNTWIKCFDAGTRLSRTRATYCLYAGTNDTFFKPPSLMATLNAISSTTYFCLGANESHWMSMPGGTISWEEPITTVVEPTYFAHVMNGNNPPLPVLHPVEKPATPNTIAFTVENAPSTIDPWFFISWDTGTKDWPKRVWARMKAVKAKDGSYTCTIPAPVETFDWYGGISFTLTEGNLSSPMSLSTHIIRHDAQPAK